MSNAPAGTPVPRSGRVRSTAGGDRRSDGVPRRPRSPGSGVAVAVAGGLPGSAGHVPVGARPDERVSRLRVHLRPDRAAVVGRGVRPRAVRRDRRPGGRRALGARGRLVGGTRLQHARRGELRPAGSLRPAVSAVAVLPDGHGRHERRPVRPQRDAAADPARAGHGQLHLPAPGAARGRSRAVDVLVGGTRRQPGAGLPDPQRVRQRARCGRRTAGEGDRRRPTDRRDDHGVLRGRQPRRRSDPGQPRLHPPVRPDGLVRSADARPARGTTWTRSSPRSRPGASCPSGATTCSTTRRAATRRTRASRPGSSERRPRCSRPNGGRRC